MERYFQQHGFRTFAFAGEWKDLKEHLEKGRPLIVALKPGGSDLHYVVVAGLDWQQGVVLKNDPAERKLLKQGPLRLRKRMESRWQLDFAGRASARGSRIASVILTPSAELCFFAGLLASAHRRPTASRISKSYSKTERWDQLVREVESASQRGAEIDYYYGSALAHLGRWNEARAAFLAGRRLRPHDERFPIELGGVAFKQKRYAEAARWLREGLRLAPNDAYANDFLATIYFLEGNTEAALKYWNRVAKPHLENVRIEPGLRVDPALLDRAFSFAPASTLRLPDFLTTQTASVDLGIFPAPNWHLEALDDGEFRYGLPSAGARWLGERKVGSAALNLPRRVLSDGISGILQLERLGDQPDISRALGRTEAPLAGFRVRAVGAEPEVPLPGRRRSAQ